VIIAAKVLLTVFGVFLGGVSQSFYRDREYALHWGCFGVALTCGLVAAFL